MNRPAPTEQRHRQRDLRRRERRAEPRRRPRAGRLARLALERETQIGPRAVQRREQAEEQARAERERGGEQQHASGRRAEVSIGAPRAGSSEAISVERPARDEQAGEAAERARAGTTR